MVSRRTEEQTWHDEDAQAAWAGSWAGWDRIREHPNFQVDYDAEDGAGGYLTAGFNDLSGDWGGFYRPDADGDPHLVDQVWDAPSGWGADDS